MSRHVEAYALGARGLIGATEIETLLPQLRLAALSEAAGDPSRIRVLSPARYVITPPREEPDEDALVRRLRGDRQDDPN